MKKILLTVILLTFCAVIQLNAQFVKFSIGIEGGGTVSSFMLKNEQIQTAQPIGYGGYGGAILDLKFGNVVGLGLGINYSYLTSGYIVGDLSVALAHQYFQIPVILQLWMGRNVAFQLGLQQSILSKASYSESFRNSIFTENEDSGAAKYYLSAVAGFKFNLGKVIYLSLKGTYGFSQAYNFYGEGKPLVTGHLGLGIRIYSYQKSAFK